MGLQRLKPLRRTEHACAVRLGFRQINGLKEDEIAKLIGNRGNFYASIERLSATAGISASAIQRLAEADAFGSLDLDRRAALWMARRLGRIDAPIWKSRQALQDRNPLCRSLQHIWAMNSSTSRTLPCRQCCPANRCLRIM